MRRLAYSKLKFIGYSSPQYVLSGFYHDTLTSFNEELENQFDN